MKDNLRIKENAYIFCAKHNGWFFSKKLVKDKKIPVECPVCHNQKYWEERMRNWK